MKSGYTARGVYARPSTFSVPLSRTHAKNGKEQKKSFASPRQVQLPAVYSNKVGKFFLFKSLGLVCDSDDDDSDGDEEEARVTYNTPANDKVFENVIACAIVFE